MELFFSVFIALLSVLFNILLIWASSGKLERGIGKFRVLIQLGACINLVGTASRLITEPIVHLGNQNGRKTLIVATKTSFLGEFVSRWILATYFGSCVSALVVIVAQLLYLYKAIQKPSRKLNRQIHLFGLFPVLVGASWTVVLCEVFAERADLVPIADDLIRDVSFVPWMEFSQESRVVYFSPIYHQLDGEEEEKNKFNWKSAMGLAWFLAIVASSLIFIAIMTVKTTWILPEKHEINSVSSADSEEVKARKEKIEEKRKYFRALICQTCFLIALLYLPILVVTLFWYSDWDGHLGLLSIVLNITMSFYPIVHPLCLFSQGGCIGERVLEASYCTWCTV